MVIVIAHIVSQVTTRKWMQIAIVYLVPPSSTIIVYPTLAIYTIKIIGRCTSSVEYSKQYMHNSVLFVAPWKRTDTTKMINPPINRFHLLLDTCLVTWSMIGKHDSYAISDILCLKTYTPLIFNFKVWDRLMDMNNKISSFKVTSFGMHIEMIQDVF